MEANENDTNHLDSDVLLPPRKRLLAGLKRQSSESPSQSSLENSSSPFPFLNEFDSRLQNLLKSYKNGPHMSSEELAKAAGSAAVAAAKAAEVARAAAEEKAAIAAKAVAAAKNALSLVATFSKGRQSKKNKMKKHVPVELLYKGQQGVESGGTDEDVARKLHREINSSPRISKDSSPKNKQKKPKPSFEYENDGDPKSIVNGNGKSVSPFEADSKSDQVEEIRVDSPDGRKRGRVKQTKLPLNIGSDKDKENPKDGLNHSSSDEGSKPVSSGETNADKRVPIEAAPTWKCQDTNSPQCIKSNEVVRS